MPLLNLEDLGLEDLEAIRLLLRGGSVIDWHRLDFRGHADVDRFLRVNEFHPEHPTDMERLEELRLDSVDYLSRNFDFSLPDDVAHGVPARDLFLIASRRGRGQKWACVVLKVMHIIHHLAGRAQSTKLAISDDQIYRAIELKVMQVVEELRAAGYPIVEFEWSRKPKDSLITKLLAKRSTLAAKIYDKLRFRLIVRDRNDLVPMLAALHRRLIPFNYVVPGESVNHLLSFRELIHGSEHLKQLEKELQHDQSLERRQERIAASPVNEFSANEYKILNFVADLPIRIHDFDSIADPEIDDGHVVFALTEFQLADKQTTVQNELGDSSHDAYKARQYRSVRLRLMRGRRARRGRKQRTS
ncbi:MAG: TIGR04552 family protein [Deltaproteobacteria bacterium]|nr:TIGR04552 family protein [Deltaproteobacteria bacterium]